MMSNSEARASFIARRAAFEHGEPVDIEVDALLRIGTGLYRVTYDATTDKLALITDERWKAELQIARLREADDVSLRRYADLPVFESPEAVRQAHPGAVCLCGVDLAGHNPERSDMEAAELALRHQIDGMGSDRFVAVSVTKGERPVQINPRLLAKPTSFNAWGYPR